MKKRLACLILIICFSHAIVAASGTIIDISVSPFGSFQLMIMRAKVHYSSTSGWGGKFGCALDAGKINLGFIVQYSNFRYKEFSEPYHVIGINAKLGFPKKISEKVSFDGNVNIGMDIRSIYSTTQVFPSIGIYAGFNFGVSEKVVITNGVDIELSIQPSKYEYNNSIDIGILGNVGIQIKL